LATAVFAIATLGLRIYLRWIGSTGYTYGALATPIAFLLFAFFGGFSIMIGAELNAAIQEEWPAGATHAHRLRNWVLRHAGVDHTVKELAIPQQDTAAAEPKA
jgi:membrane protein